MIELGQLEAHHQEFAQRNTRVVVASIEDVATAKLTQNDYPHLLVVADPDRKLAGAVGVIHPHSAPDGGDTAAPTTILIDGAGIVRWTYRADRVFTRLGPAEVLAAVDRHVSGR